MYVYGGGAMKVAGMLSAMLAGDSLPVAYGLTMIAINLLGVPYGIAVQDKRLVGICALCAAMYVYWMAF